MGISTFAISDTYSRSRRNGKLAGSQNQTAEVKIEQAIGGFYVYILFGRRWPVSSFYYKAIMYWFFHPAMATVCFHSLVNFHW